MKKFTVLVFVFIIHYFPIRRLIGISTAIAVSTLLITHCSAQWYQISLPVSGSVLQMQFINSNTGWVVVSQSGYGYSMLRTTNQGTNWFVIYSDSSKVGRFQFVNDTLGYAMGYYQGYHLISRTTNSGYNWTIVRSSFSDVNGGFYMVSRDTGWVCVFRFPTTVILMTTDGFQSVQDISTGAGGTPSTLFFFKEKYNNQYCGYILGAGILNKTTNSGYNWQEINTGFTGDINSFSFINKDTGWVVQGAYTTNSRILKSMNGGNNWITQYEYPVFSYEPNYIYAISNNIIYCGILNFNYKILISTNGGSNWGNQTSQIWNNAIVYMYDSNIGFAWTGNQVVRTTNSGGTINQIANSKEQVADEYKLYQNYPNPFNAVSSIKYKVLSKAKIMIKVYDIIGKEITTLVNGKQSQGIYEVKFDGARHGGLSSGIYFYSLFVDGIRIDTKKLVLLK